MSDPLVNELVDSNSSALPTIVVLQHAARDPLGAMDATLSRAANLVRVCGYDDLEEATALVETLMRTGDYHGVVGLGGPMGVYQADAIPHVQLSLRLFRDALTRDIPILGLCLGSQMLAEVLGYPVYPGAERGLPFEVGFHPLKLTEAGRADPVARLFGEEWPVLMWHGDTHDLPQESVLLASSDTYAIQAFRLNKHTYGLQFHPEADFRVFRIWVEESVPMGKFSAEFGAELVAQSAALDPVVRRRAEQLALLFIDWAREYHAVATRRG